MNLCTDTITVFNPVLDPDTGLDEYRPTVISGVSWYCRIVSTVASAGGLIAANTFTIRIPTNADFGGKTYLDPLTYAATGKASANFTLRSGDIIVKGAVTDTGLRLVDLKQKFAEVVTVLAVTDNRRAPNAPHWKVVGK